MSSVHAGSGSEIGIVDLPVQREKHTGYPKIESSSLKGAIRATVEEGLWALKDPGLSRCIVPVFGSYPQDSREEGEAQAGAVALSDARTLLFPVKSLRGVFAWLTCPYALERYNQEATRYTGEDKALPVPRENTISSKKIQVGGNNIVLEEYTFPVQVDKEAGELAKRIRELIFPGFSSNLLDRLVVLGDDDFSDFVKLSTEINARIRIEPKAGVVKEGALWYEENVPPETVFYSFVFAGDARQEDTGNGDYLKAGQVMGFLKDGRVLPEIFQLGGSSTLGRGLLRRVWV